MILKPFTIVSEGKTYTYVDRLAMDSEALKEEVLEITRNALEFSQQDAMCEAVGVPEVGSIPSMKFGVFENNVLVGVWMLGCIEYISGPWKDVVGGEKERLNDPARFTARAMPGFLTLLPRDENTLSTDTAVQLLSTESPFASLEDIAVGFNSLHWAIFKDRTDPISVRSNRLHNAAVAHRLLKVTEEPDPIEAGRTLATLELQ